MWEKLQHAARKLGITSNSPTDLALFRGTSTTGKSKRIDSRIVKSRPPSAADDYLLLHDDDTLDGVFHRLKAAIYSDIDDQRAKRAAVGIITPSLMREYGRVSANRQYFFIKPPRNTGWLFERSGTGWVISRADKIVEENTFVRHGEPWDIVAVFGSKNGGAVRVSSPRLRDDLLSFNTYQRKLLDCILNADDADITRIGQ